MFNRQLPEGAPKRQRRIAPATIALWIFVIIEAIAIGVAVWYMAGGTGSR